VFYRIPEVHNVLAIVSTERKGKTDRNDWDTTCGNFYNLISSQYHYKNGGGFFHYKNNILVFCTCYLVATSDIYRQQATTFSALA
jgi:hypothetical protein